MLSQNYSKHIKVKNNLRYLRNLREIKNNIH